MTRSDVTNQLQQAAEQYTLQDLSEKTGLDKPHLSRILRGQKNPTLDTIIKITNALNLTISIK